MSNEAQKVHSLFLKFSELKHNGEVREQLNSIRVLLELVMNDRKLLQPSTSSTSLQNHSHEQPQLNEIVSMYQSKLEEMTVAF